MIVKPKNYNKIDEIISFWENEKPHIIGPIKLCPYFRKSAIECVIDFLEIFGRKIEDYPWNKKIFEKRKELFGF